MEPLHLIILGLVLVAGAFSMIRTNRKVAQSRRRDLLGETTESLKAARGSVVGELRAMEVRMLEHARDVEGQLATRIAVLDEMIRQADERITELRQLRSESEIDGEPGPTRRAA